MTVRCGPTVTPNSFCQLSRGCAGARVCGCARYRTIRREHAALHAKEAITNAGTAHHPPLHRQTRHEQDLTQEGLVEPNPPTVAFGYVRSTVALAAGANISIGSSRS